MDFWSRIIGGSRSLSTKSPRAASPTERLTAFKRTCNTLQQIWRSSNSPTGEQAAAVHARNCIERLNSVLSDESRGPAPHPCLAYAASSQIFVTVTKLALSSYDEGMLRSATIFFNTLIDSEVDGVVDNRLFARALVDLVRRADKQSEDIEGRLVELLFGVSNNIRLQPTILPAWFAPRSDDQNSELPGANGVEFAGTMRKDDFPLFYLLVEYVHHAGRAGDFARTGLLYLIETASRSKDLERWLIESDLATLMATGLGALYSQLGSLSYGPDGESEIPHIIAHSDHAQQETALPPVLGVSMDSFMAYLLFWQDTIDHCKSAEVVATLLDHFQVLFLEQLLYPSLLESSDVEGGSTAAVLTYLYRILASIDQEDLVHRILHFLLASPPDSDTQIAKKNKNMSASRRKSLDVLTAFSEEAARPSPSLFNLRDLALLGLRSSNPQTVLATLRLLSVVLQRHPSFARSLIRTITGHPAKQRNVGTLNAELGQLLSMASSIMNEPTLDKSFGNYLKDAAWTLESRLCISTSDKNPTEAVALEVRRDDPIVRELLDCLETFFTNSLIVNLALTEVLVSIASSQLIALDGWLLVDSTKYKYTTSDSSKDGLPDILQQIHAVYQEPIWSPEDTPALTAVLSRLVAQVQNWRNTITDFDILIAARRDLLHENDDPFKGSSEQDPIYSSTRGSVDRPPSTTPRTPQLNADQGTPRGRRDKQNFASPQRSIVGSPLREPTTIRSHPPRTSSVARSAAAEELKKRLATPFRRDSQSPLEPNEDAGNTLSSSLGPTTETSADTDNEAIIDEEQKTEQDSATLGHVLTNVVVLYEFLLEISAMVQARGTLFEEAGFHDVRISAQDSAE
ncbi:Retinoic acid induced 16-like protein-domain-containing protein [Aspergillus pseudoustus]|uniref:Retinoic acid induced 16-like protein-domain-containing protein n=1 Tax=Aspergillus pseudoustus TaxID=1810923 RepID=A0ABR4J630_9EURO